MENALHKYTENKMSLPFKQRVKAIVAKIRAIRRSKNYSQDYLAAKMHMSQNAYSKIELGHTNITLEDFLRIVELLEADECELLDCR